MVLFSSHDTFFKPVNTVYKNNFKICKFFIILILFSYFFEKIGGKPLPMSMSSIKKKLSLNFLVLYFPGKVLMSCCHYLFI